MIAQTPAFVRLRQLPVGQGGFAVSEIAFSSAEAFRFIYDCGARSRSPLGERIEEVGDQLGNHADVLFISHLDADHVDGIDRLLERIRVDTVVLPYLEAVQQAIVVVGSDSGMSGSLREISCGPGTWLGARGVTRVILVRSGPGADSSPSDVEGPFPFEPDAGTEIGKLTGPTGSPGVGLGTVPPTAPDHRSSPEGAEVVLLDHRGGVVLTVAGGIADWVLLPFVPSISNDQNIRAFRNALAAIVRKQAGLATGDEWESKLGEVLRDPDCRKQIRFEYNLVGPNLGSGRHNAASMSLYSGPIRPFGAPWHVDATHSYPFGFRSADRPGWVATGDAPLRAKSRMREWLSFYGPYLQACSCLVLPHHGSARSFNSALLTETSIDVFIAPAAESGGYQHPSPIVRKHIASHGRQLVHVTEHAHSEWLMYARPR